MDPYQRWEKLSDEPLGSGGQGTVYLVCDKSKFDKEKASIILQESIPYMGAAVPVEQKQLHSERLIKAVGEIFFMNDSSSWGALKVLKTHEARDPERSKERMRREIDAMKRLSHPNLVRILDVDPDYEWYVMKHYQRGTLTHNRDHYTGDLERTLHDFYPLLDAVASIHNEGLVHRDIKPENIFIDDDGTLVLSDFGLVYELDESGERLSGTEENVGTHAWMPAWGMDVRVGPTPAFDVFSLGKVLWWMISGKGNLQLWYYDRGQFNLETLFPENHLMKLVNKVLAKCVIEEEETCLLNASQLLSEVNNCMSLVCQKCGKGSYDMLPDTAQKMLDDRLVWQMCSNCNDIRIGGGKLLSEVIGFTAKHNPLNAQGGEWRYVDTKGGLLKSLRFKVESSSSRWRAGFMIGEPNPETKQPLPVHPNNLLFHVGITDGRYAVTAWEGNSHILDDDMPISDDGSILISFTHDNGSDLLTCKVNGKPYPFEHVDPTWFNSVVLLAWADGPEYAVDFRDIETIPTFGLLDRLATL